MPPDVPVKMIQCGPNLEPLKPTPYLRFAHTVGRVLEQWFEATCTVDGVTYTKGEWLYVPR
jgi:hypothetical protein